MSIQSLRILVVDDDRDAADSLAELFEMEGHQVTVVYNGEDAVVAHRDTSFDIAFMDIMMPGKNGVESFFEIRRHRPDAKVFMMTGYSVEQLIAQAIEHGAMGILPKPVALDKVLTVLEEVLPAGVILVAEDDPDFGPELKNMISDAGHKCGLATSGRDAIDQAKAGGIDVLILDLNLPIIDGIEVYSIMSKEGVAVPTIIVTDRSGEHADTLEAMQDVSVTGVLNKPFDPSRLLDRLDNLITG